MADPVVHITNGIPDSGTGNITTLGMILSVLPAALGVGGGLKVDGSGTALPVSGSVTVSGTATVSGSVTANAGTNLNTSALALEAGGNLANIFTTIGSAVASPAANTIGDRLKVINATLGSPFQVGGSIGNTTFASIQSGSWTVQPGNTPNTTPWLVTINDGANSAAVKAASTAAVAADKSLVVAISPNVFGNAVMANSMPVTIASNQSAVPASQSGAWSVGSSSATGAGVPANAFYKGLLAKTALPSAGTDGNLVGAMGDKFGRQVVLPQGSRDLVGTQQTNLSATVAETTIVSAGAAGIFNDLAMIVISNTSVGTTTRIDFRDDTGGAIIFSLNSIGGAPPMGFSPPFPLPQSGAAKNWTAQCSVSTVDVRIFALFVKNK